MWDISFNFSFSVRHNCKNCSFKREKRIVSILASENPTFRNGRRNLFLISRVTCVETTLHLRVFWRFDHISQILRCRHAQPGEGPLFRWWPAGGVLFRLNSQKSAKFGAHTRKSVPKYIRAFERFGGSERENKRFGPKGQGTSLPPQSCTCGGGGWHIPGGLTLVLTWLMARGGWGGGLVGLVGVKQGSRCWRNYWSSNTVKNSTGLRKLVSARLRPAFPRICPGSTGNTCVCWLWSSQILELDPGPHLINCDFRSRVK